MAIREVVIGASDEEADWIKHVKKNPPDVEMAAYGSLLPTVQALVFKHPGHPDQQVHNPHKGKKANGGGGDTFKVADHNALAGAYEAFDDCKAMPIRCDAVHQYTTFAYETINKDLRLGKSPDDFSAKDENRQYTRKIDAWIENTPPVPENMKVFRNVENDFAGQLKEGSIFQDSGFVSTTISKDQLSTGFGNSTLEIRVPKGTQGAYISEISEFPGENEFLLPRGSRFKVVSTTLKKGQFTSLPSREIVLELVQ